MSEPVDVDALIEDARRLSGAKLYERDLMLDHLVGALVQLRDTRDDILAHVREDGREHGRLERALAKAERERDEALAVIERAKAAATYPRDTNDVVRRELNQSPSAALDAVKAEAWDEGFDAGERDVFQHEKHGWGDERCIPNPYRKGGD